MCGRLASVHILLMNSNYVSYLEYKMHVFSLPLLYKCDLPYYGILRIGGFSSTFRYNISDRFQESSSQSRMPRTFGLTGILRGVLGPLKMGPTGYPKTSVKYYLSALSKIPGGCISFL